VIVFAANAGKATPNQEDPVRVITLVKDERLFREFPNGRIIIFFCGVISGLPLEIPVGFETSVIKNLFESFRGKVTQQGRRSQMIFETSLTIKLIQARFPFWGVTADFPQPLPANFQQLRATIGDDRGRARRAPGCGDFAEHFARFEPGGVVFA